LTARQSGFDRQQKEIALKNQCVTMASNNRVGVRDDKLAKITAHIVKPRTPMRMPRSAMSNMQMRLSGTAH
jgi:hypothetical protein